MDYSAIALVLIVGMLAYNEISALKRKISSLDNRLNQLSKLTGHDDLSSYSVPVELEEQAIQLKRDGKKIQAIKVIRDQTKMDLREAKQYVDQL